MAIKFLDKTGLGYFWGKIKSWVTSRGYITSSGSITGNAATATRLAGPKHSYTTAANAAKNWYRIANANTSQIDTTKPLHVQFMLTAYNTSVNKDYYQRWFVDCEVFGRQSGVRVFGNSSVPFQYVRVLYENTDASVTTSNRPAIDIYLNYVIASVSNIEIEEINNSGFDFLADGVLAVSTVPSGFESRQVSVYGSGVQYASSCDYAGRTRLQRSNITANATLANNDTYRSRVLNCTNAITITVPSLDSDYVWFLIKNFNAASTNKDVTIHPSTTSVLIDDSNADIVLKPGEWVIIASKAANSYTLISDGRWKSQKADKATTLAGYGITDAKIGNGTITLGSNSITPLTSHQTLPTLSRTISGSGNAITDITVSNHAITATKGSTFAIDSNVVHKSGSEVITGIKEFKNQYHDSTRTGETDWESTSLILRIPNYSKGTTPSTRYFGNILILDKDGDNIDWGGRLASLETDIDPVTSTNIVKILAYKNEIVNGVDAWDTAGFAVGFDGDGNKFAYCPPTREDRNNANDILTRNWIPKDTRIVHSSGDENVGGIKTFSNAIYAPQAYLRGLEFNQTVSNSGHGGYIDFHFNGDTSDYTSRIIEPESGKLSFYAIPRFINQNGVVSIRSSSLTRGELPNETQYNKWYISYADKNGNEIGCDQYAYTSQGRIVRRIITYGWVPHGSTNSSTFAQIAVGFQAGTITDGVQTALGAPFASCPSTPDTGEGSDIVTRNWIPKDTRIVHTTGNETIAGDKTLTGNLKISRNWVNLVAQNNHVDFADNTANSEWAGFWYINDKNGIHGMITSAWHYANGAIANARLAAIPGNTSSNLGTVWQSLPSGIGQFIPYSNNTMNLGSSTMRWKEVFAVTGTINTSDERLKDSIESVPDEILDAWEEIDWVQFKMKDAIQKKGNSARLHSGLIAQRIDEIFKLHNLNVSDYGLFCYDEWEALEPIYDDKGDIAVPPLEAGNMYSLRYEEALALEAAYQRRKNKILENRISELENQLSSMLQTLKELKGVG